MKLFSARFAVPVAALIVAAGAGGALLTAGSGSAATAGDAKAAAIAAAPSAMSDAQIQSVLAPAGPPVVWSAAVVAADSSPSTAALIAAVQRTIAGDLKAHEAPAAAAARHGKATDQQDAARRRGEIESDWASDKSAAQEDAAQKDLTFLADHPEVDSFDDVSIGALTWNAIDVAGNQAHVIVTGSTRRHDSGSQTWVDEGAHQWQLSLRLEPAHWKTTDETVLLGADYGK